MNMRIATCKYLVFTSLLLSGFLVDTGARAACFNKPLDGIWVNGDAKVKELIKLKIVHECTQEETPEGLVVPGARWWVRAWTKCYPANCVWGNVVAQKDPAGQLNASMSTYAADRFVKVKFKSGTTNEINAHVVIDFHDPRRKDIDVNVALERVK